MGNHTVGAAMVALVEAIAARRRPDETGLSILDEAAERTEIRGADAEFDDAPYEDGIFRSILIEAFNPTYDETDDEDGDEFYETVYEPFSKRYELC